MEAAVVRLYCSGKGPQTLKRSSVYTEAVPDSDPSV